MPDELQFKSPTTGKVQGVSSKHWDEAAEYARLASEATADEVRHRYLVSLGQAMNCAYQTSDDLLAWWKNRLGVSDGSA